MSIDPSSLLFSSHSRARSFLPFSDDDDDDAQHIIRFLPLPFFLLSVEFFFSR